MYCHYCGNVALGACATCHHRVCPDHARRLLGLRVCQKCRPFAAASMVLLSMFAGAAWVALR